MARLHRIEALPGAGRYAVTFQRDDLSEQTAVVQMSGADLGAAEASLPAGWTRDSDAFAALAGVVRAIEHARAKGPTATALVDVDGGWDVMMGNVVLDGDKPTCTAHGPMEHGAGDVFACSECGARAAYALPG
ncbi:MAG: hypothetical protein ACRDVG_11940 [Jatrophihabitantaceae bacterium]